MRGDTASRPICVAVLLDVFMVVVVVVSITTEKATHLLCDTLLDDVNGSTLFYTHRSPAAFQSLQETTDADEIRARCISSC